MLAGLSGFGPNAVFGERQIALSPDNSQRIVKIDQCFVIIVFMI